jgi:hypothetical protein
MLSKPAQSFAVIAAVTTLLLNVSTYGVTANQTSAPTSGPETVRQAPDNPGQKSQTAVVCGDGAGTPCLNQPVAGAKAITGKAAAGASLDLILDAKKVASTTALQDGTFQFSVDALAQTTMVEVDQTAPAAVTMGPVSIGTKGICDDTGVKPCLNQPMVSAKTVTGKATSGASIDLKVGGKKIGSTNALKDDTFQFAVDGLTLGSQVEADQTAPSSVTMGPVTTKSNGICSADAGTPCMKQPVADDKKVSGKAAAGASITLKLKKQPVGTTTADSNSNFTFGNLEPLEAGAEVEADQTAPTPVTMGPTNVRDNRICGKSNQIPCVDQPEAGATKITGKAKTGASVDVIIDDKKVGTGTGNSGNQFEVSVDALKLGSSVEADQTAPETVDMGPVAVIPSPAASSLYTLGLVGLNATGSSTSGPKAQYFAEFDVISPLHWAGRGCWSPLKKDKQIVHDPDGNPVHEDKVYPLAGRCWIWLNPRVASAPETASTALTSVSSASSLTQPIGAQTVGQITQTFEFQAGLEYYVIKPWNGALFGSGNSWAKTSLSLILGGGTLTPFNSISTASEYGLNNNLGKQFNQSVAGNPNQNLSQTYPVLAGALCNFGFTGSATVTCPNPPVTGLKTAAFVFPNRSRFYRDYYGGFRIRTFYFSGRCQTQPNGRAAGACRSANVYPGTFDLRLGQDETVTGGFLRGVVLTLTGSYPLPGTDGTVRIFGSSYLRLHKNANTTALVMVASQSFTSLDDPSVVVQQIKPSDQDYYRLGIGVDLVPLIHKWYTASQSTTTTTK